MKKVIYIGLFLSTILLYACKEKQLDCCVTPLPVDFGGSLKPIDKHLFAYLKPDERGTDGCDTHIQLVFDSLNENSNSYYFKPTILTKYKADSLITIRKNQNKLGRIKVKLEYVLTNKKVELDCFWNKPLTNEGEIERIEFY
jgi:hypothetical protein